jgi:vitamin B12/bleomycin/antimicrobial peptide transport system ATP-binding/permease protein
MVNRQNNSMNRFNLNIFKRFWSLGKLYWLGNEKKGALTLLFLLFLLLLAHTQLSVLLNQQQGNIISSLSAQKIDRFQATIKTFFIILVIYVPLIASFGYVQGILGNYWRKWLTSSFLNRYFSQRAFYELGNFNTELDNPDQRIAEDIKGFTVDSLGFMLSIVGSFFQVIFFSVALWKISQGLVYVLLVYTLFGSAITLGVFGRKLVKINFNQIKKEANFRFGLVRIRENSESIAFYQGENQENQSLKSKFEEVFQNFNLLVLWKEVYLGLFSNPYNFFPYILPAIVIAPQVLAGDLEVGKVTEAAGAFAMIFRSLNLIVDQFKELTAFAASIERLSSLKDYLDHPQVALEPNVVDCPIIKTIQHNNLAINNLTLQTPNYQRTLIRNLSVNLPTGEGLLITGASGCGKSSLLRAIAGLWDSGSGTIYRPDLSKIMFLPQKPYMILGTLRNQLIYPHEHLEIAEQDLNYALEKVNLGDLANRLGGFEVEKDWDEILSLGEQQRLAFARVLVNQPRYVVLDEATSALDINNEAILYQYLLKNSTTFISVGHRPSLNQYHRWLLVMQPGEKWQLQAAK